MAERSRRKTNGFLVLLVRYIRVTGELLSTPFEEIMIKIVLVGRKAL